MKTRQNELISLQSMPLLSVFRLTIKFAQFMEAFKEAGLRSCGWLLQLCGREAINIIDEARLGILCRQTLPHILRIIQSQMFPSIKGNFSLRLVMFSIKPLLQSSSITDRYYTYQVSMYQKHSNI